jgi:putative alpha-1,2-mannosidase
MLDGHAWHWSPYASNSSSRVVEGPLSTDSGFWDAWNTVYPLLTLSNRPVLGTMMTGWLNAYKEGSQSSSLPSFLPSFPSFLTWCAGGWLPKWASPGYRGSMVGTMGDVSVADAIVNGIPGFDTQLAYEAIRKDAFDTPPLGVTGVGRTCIASYLKYGFIPSGAPATDGKMKPPYIPCSISLMDGIY